MALTDLSLGDICRRTGRLKDSEEFLLKSVTALKRWMAEDTTALLRLPNSLRYLGLTYQELGKLNEALEAYDEEKALRINMGEETFEVESRRRQVLQLLGHNG